MGVSVEKVGGKVPSQLLGALGVSQGGSRFAESQKNFIFADCLPKFLLLARPQVIEHPRGALSFYHGNAANLETEGRRVVSIGNGEMRCLGRSSFA